MPYIAYENGLVGKEPHWSDDLYDLSQPLYTTHHPAYLMGELQHLPAEIHINVNDKPLTLHGTVKMRENGGAAQVSVDFERRDLPAGFQPELLCYVLITGYGAATKSLAGSHNPSLGISSDSEITRTLQLADCGFLETRYFVYRGKGRPAGLCFNITGKVDCRKALVAMHPTVERWSPIKADAIPFAGHMPFSWVQQDGTTLQGWAHGVYNFGAQAVPLSRSQLRIITFDLQRRENGFTLNESIFLVDEEDWRKQADYL